jgi:hypothetical protein
MKRIAISLACLSMIVSGTEAKEGMLSKAAKGVYKAENYVVLRSLQCEIGRSTDAVEAASRRKDLKAHLKLESGEVDANEVEGSGKLLVFTLSGTPGQERYKGWYQETSINFNHENIKACADKTLVKELTVSDCIKENAGMLGNPENKFGCKDEATISLGLKGGLDGDVGAGKLGVNVKHTAKLVYKIDVGVPDSASSSSVPAPNFPVPSPSPSDIVSDAFDLVLTTNR